MPKKIRELKAMLVRAGFIVRAAKGSHMKSHYSMLIQWSEDDQAFVVSLPEFGEGCKTHGATYEEAVKNGREVLELLIESYEAEGRTLPAPGKLAVSVSA